MSVKVVKIQNMEFSPDSIEIIVRDTVIWKNLDSTQHSAIRIDAPMFDTGLLNQNEESEPIEFCTESNDSGFNYKCGPHAFMRGTITVKKS
jgi:plastocyanin